MFHRILLFEPNKRLKVSLRTSKKNVFENKIFLTFFYNGIKEADAEKEFANFVRKGN